MQQSLHTFFSLVGEMAPYLLLGFLVAGILHAFVPRRLYTRYLADNDMRSVTAAALIGIPLPLCSCGVIPTAMSMHRDIGRWLIVGLLIAGAMLTRHSHDEKHTTMEQTYRIRGMMCNHCKANVERGLAALEGVTAVHVDLDEGTARVEGTAPRERVIREIERLGYRCVE